MACKVLASDEQLADTLRYQGTILPADFRRALGDEQVRAVKLYDYWEMRAKWEELGGSTTLSMKRLFERVETEAGPRWRLRSLTEQVAQGERVQQHLEAAKTPDEEEPPAPKDERSGDRKPHNATKYFPTKPEDWQKDN